MITLKQLRYFISLAENLHFAKAADECAISQPALSMQIKELEVSLGAPLVERGKGRIEITPIGKEVLRRSQNILHLVQDLRDCVQHEENLLSGPLKIGVIPTVAPYLLPKALPKLKKLFPSLELSIRESQTSSLIRELKKGHLDVILIAVPHTDEDKELSFKKLFVDRFVLVTNMQNQTLSPFKTIEKNDLLLLEEGHCLRDQVIAFCRAKKPKALSNFGSASLTTITQMVAHGYGATLLPEIAQKAEIGRRQSIHIMRFPEPQPKRTLGLVWRKTSPRTADFEALGDVLRECGENMIEDLKE